MITPDQWKNLKSILIGLTQTVVLAASQYLSGADWGQWQTLTIPAIGFLTAWLLRQLPSPSK